MTVAKSAETGSTEDTRTTGADASGGVTPAAHGEGGVGSMIGRLARRLDQIADRQSHDAWVLETLNEQIDRLARALETGRDAKGATNSDDDRLTTAMYERLDARLDAMHFAIGAAPKAIAALTERLTCVEEAMAVAARSEADGVEITAPTVDAWETIAAAVAEVGARLQDFETDQSNVVGDTARALCEELPRTLSPHLEQLVAQRLAAGLAHADTNADQRAQALTTRLETTTRDTARSTVSALSTAIGEASVRMAARVDAQIEAALTSKLATIEERVSQAVAAAITPQQVQPPLDPNALAATVAAAVGPAVEQALAAQRDWFENTFDASRREATARFDAIERALPKQADLLSADALRAELSTQSAHLGVRVEAAAKDVKSEVARVETVASALASRVSEIAETLDAVPATETATSTATVDALRADWAATAADQKRVVEQHAATLTAVTARFDDVWKSVGSEARAMDALRGRIERLLAAFGPVADNVAEAVSALKSETGADASAAVTAKLDEIQGAIAGLATLNETADDTSAQVDVAAALAALKEDWSATVANQAQTLEQHGDMLTQFGAQLGDVWKSAGSEARSTEALRGRVERLLAAFGPVSQEVATAVAALQAQGSSGDAIADVATKLEALEGAVTALSEQDNTAGAAPNASLDTVARAMSDQRDAIERLTGRLDAQIAKGAGMITAQELVRRRVDAMFTAAQQLLRAQNAWADAPSAPVADGTFDESAPVDGDDVAAEFDLVGATYTFGGDVETGASAPAIVENGATDQSPEAPTLAQFDAAHQTTLRVATGFRVLFRRLSAVVDRFEAAAETLGPRESAASFPHMATAIDVLRRRVEEAGATMLQQRDQLSAEAADEASVEDGGVDMRVARLEATAVEFTRVKEEFLEIAAATTRALDEAQSGRADS